MEKQGSEPRSSKEKAPTQAGRQELELRSSKEKIRVQLDFTHSALEALDKLKVRINANTRAETIRRALRLLWWFVTEVQPEDIITITNKDREIVSKFKASLLDYENLESYNSGASE